MVLFINKNSCFKWKTFKAQVGLYKSRIHFLAPISVRTALGHTDISS